MTFGKWRQQLRLMEAMRLLAEGAKVTHAALEAGYSTPSGSAPCSEKLWVPPRVCTSESTINAVAYPMTSIDCVGMTATTFTRFIRTGTASR
jgi:AraC-like DNA-binding protein